MLKVKNMKFRNLILLVGTIGITKALDGNEILVSTSGIIGNVIANDTSVSEASPFQPVDTANLCISTLTLSTCTCEPKGSQSINSPGETPIYEGDEWDRYAEIPKATSTTLSPDCVLTTNFSTNSLHGRSTVKNEKGSSVTTHSSRLRNITMTSSMAASHTGVLSLTFPSIHISSTRGHNYNILTFVRHHDSFHTGYHNSSISKGYSNISSTLESASLSSHISTEEYSKIEGFSTSGKILTTTVAESEASLSSSISLNSSAAEPENPTSYASENEEIFPTKTEINKSLVPSLTLQSNVTFVDFYPTSTAETTQDYQTEDHKTIYETAHKSSESSIASSSKKWITMGSSLYVHQHSTTSNNVKTSQSSLNSEPTTQPENNWPDYWNDENWSEEWPSEFWSDVFEETSKTTTPTYSKTHFESEKHSTLSSIKTHSQIGRKSHNEHRSTSKLQSSISSTHTTERSFRILPTSHMPKQTSHSVENTSHGHTEGSQHHTEEPQHHTEKHHTEEHHTEEHHKEEQSTKEHNTKLSYSEESTENPSLSLPSSISESSESIHETSESQYFTTSKSKQGVQHSSISESHSISTLISSMSVSPPLSLEHHSAYSSKKHPKASSGTPTSNGPSISTSTHLATNFSTGSSHLSKTTNYSKRSRLNGTGSISSQISTTYLSSSRTYPRKKSYSPIFTLKPAPSMLSLGNARQARPFSQTNSEETETETETLHITIQQSTETSKSMVQSSHLMQPTSSKNLTVSENESASSTLVRPYHILKPNEETETNSSESNASKTTIYYLLLVPSFILLVL